MLKIGVDVVDITRFESILGDHPRLASRLFTTTELAYAQSRQRPAQHLAARFAAKEAVFKALGKGWPELSWHDVAVTSQGGPPVITLSGRAAQLVPGAHVSVSLAHDGGVAIAQVVIQEAQAEAVA